MVPNNDAKKELQWIKVGQPIPGMSHFVGLNRNFNNEIEFLYEVPILHPKAFPEYSDEELATMKKKLVDFSKPKSEEPV